MENDSVFSLIHDSYESISVVYKYFFKTFCMVYKPFCWPLKCFKKSLDIFFSGTYGTRAFQGVYYNQVNLGACAVLWCVFMCVLVVVSFGGGLLVCSVWVTGLVCLFGLFFGCFLWSETQPKM